MQCRTNVIATDFKRFSQTFFYIAEFFVSKNVYTYHIYLYICIQTSKNLYSKVQNLISWLKFKFYILVPGFFRNLSENDRYHHC